MGPQQLTPHESRELARHIVDALVLKLTDEKVVDAMTRVWGKQLDLWIGRGVRRLAFYVLLAAVLMGAIKFHVWELMFK